jgi:ribosomal protein S18 acetylase RimI-like enzyme
VAVSLEPATSFGLDELASIFTRAYEGYLIPFQVDEPTLRFMVAAFDLDLAASKVARSEGQVVGLANLGIRGDEGWVGGVGVVPAARRLGVGEALMQGLLAEARARGLRRVTLEVIEENEAAFRLYDKLGFEVTRWLEIWSLPQEASEGVGEDVALATARARIGELRRSNEPWQRADETVERYASLEPAPRGLVAEGGAAVYRLSSGGVQLVQIAGEEAACRSLLVSLRSAGQVTLLNLPEGEPAGAALASLGAERRLRQREMVLELQG